MNTTDELIRDYRRGFSYHKLTIDELIEVSIDRIDDLASQYGIKKSDYGITDEDFIKYICELSSCRMDYFHLKHTKLDDDTGRWTLFVPLVTILISAIVYMVSIYFAFICIILIGWLVHKYLFPQFEDWYKNEQIEKFLAKHKIKRNYKVEEYINEVMFQAYARNKNADSKNKAQIK